MSISTGGRKRYRRSAVDRQQQILRFAQDDTSTSCLERRRSREGFTIVEVIVAMMIFCVGVLAMASTAARTINMLSSGQSRTLAAAVAANRFERLRSVSCASHSSDSTTTRGIKERWTVVKLSRADDVTVVLTFTADHNTKSLAYREYLSCL